MVIVPPGVLVNVQIPVGGKPFNTTLPVDTAHVGCVIVPTLGAAGIGFTVAMTAVLAPVVQLFAVALT